MKKKQKKTTKKRDTKVFAFFFRKLRFFLASEPISTKQKKEAGASRLLAQKLFPFAPPPLRVAPVSFLHLLVLVAFSWQRLAHKERSKRTQQTQIGRQTHKHTNTHTLARKGEPHNGNLRKIKLELALQSRPKFLTTKRAVPPHRYNTNQNFFFYTTKTTKKKYDR